MKHLIKKISRVDAQIGQISVGDTNVILAYNNDKIVVMVDGHSILSSDKGLPLEKLSPVVAQIVSKIYEGKDHSNKKLSFFKGREYDSSSSSHGFINKILSYLNKKVSKVTLEEKCGALNTRLGCDTLKIAMDQNLLVSNLDRYETQVNTLARYIDRTAELSSILTRRKLISTMHGADTTQKIINGIKDEIVKLTQESSNLPAWVSMGTKSKQKLSHRLSKNILDTDNEKVYASTVLIPNITESYDKIKNFAIKMAVAVSPLIYIDDVFKENTKFPATWFLPTNNLVDLNESYDVVLSFLIGTPEIESGLMDPLNFLKVKNSYNDENR